MAVLSLGAIPQIFEVTAFLTTVIAVEGISYRSRFSGIGRSPARRWVVILFFPLRVLLSTKNAPE
ncbi:MAG: hypothetical protein WDN29_12645 [Methylovirgula sp.]